MKRKNSIILFIFVLIFMILTMGCSGKEESELEPLFDDVYYEIATNDEIIDEDGLLKFVDKKEYSHKYDEKTRSYKILDSKTDNDNYVYVALSPILESSLIESISYYDSVKNIEVSIYNGSEDKDKEYEFMNIHIIGEPQERVDSIEDQIEFLKTFED